MKILWINDLSVKHHPGGAQQTVHLFMGFGKQRGHEVTALNHDTDINVLYRNYDIIVSSNIYILSRQTPSLIPFLSTYKNHVRYECDSNEHLTFENRKLLYDNCKLAVFLSDIHRKLFLKIYNIKPRSTAVVYPYIGRDFYDYNFEREDAVLWAGLFHPLKGSNNFVKHIRSHPNRKFVLTGLQLPKLPDNNVHYIGNVPYQEMPRVYNKYTEFYFYPTGVAPLYIEPFSRTYAEAVFCGMKANVSKNLGALIEIEKHGLEKVREKCNNAEKLFWELLE